MEDRNETTLLELARAAIRAPLPVEQLRWRCDPNALMFASTADVEPVQGVIGQDSALDALRFGMEIHAPGQNVFVRGLTGTGRMTLVSRLVDEIRPACPAAQDRCYVHNFTQPTQPRLVTLPRGQAHVFRRAVDEMADFIRDELEGALASESLEQHRESLERDTNRRIDATIKPFEEELRKSGLALVSMGIGSASHAALYPLVDGKSVSPEKWEQLRATGKVSKDEAAQFKERHDAFQQQLRSVLRKVQEFRRKHDETVRVHRADAARSILEQFVERITADFSTDEVRRFLHELVDDVARKRPVAEQQSSDFTRQYRVNVVLTNAEDGACPIIVENTPTMSNLLGTIDHNLDRGESNRTDHLMIRAGSLLRADGGYLILEVRDLLRESGAWKVLVRTLRTGRLEIIHPETVFPWPAPALKPESIRVNVKVILIGDAEMYYLLDQDDPDFSDLFKVLADFDSVIRRDDVGIAKYGGVLSRIVREEGLLHFDNTAVAALVEHGARIAGRRDRLTTRFGRLADIAREAAFIAGKTNKPRVSVSEIIQAIRRTKQRASLPSVRFQELLVDGTIRVATTGTAVGQINGLAVMQAGPLTYGFPARITATIGPGSSGVVNIDRESELSGAIHTKGFYILGGLLRYLLRTEQPLTFNASVAFEQTYGGIDGDSASAAEVCCLLSTLTEIPLRQDLAITGAIDQVGNILAVGGTNEKIEGFFDTCQQIGLSGSQGVIIPSANARDLMLRDDVVEACQQGRFRIYAVDQIQEALELLSGVAAGERDQVGRYPDNTLLGVAEARVLDYWLMASSMIQAVEGEDEVPTGDDDPENQLPPDSSG